MNRVIGHLELEVRAWDGLRDLRHRIADVLVHETPDLREAAVMTSAELAENALKYRRDDHSDVKVLLDSGVDEIAIAVSHRVTAAAAAKAEKQIAQATDARDKQAAYTARMSDLMTSGGEDSSGGLGLRRIVYEARFGLACSFVDPDLTIVATRKKALRTRTETFERDGLRITIERNPRAVRVLWRGVSDGRDPGAVLAPYLDGIVVECLGKSVTVDFTELEYMNSATVSPILNFIKMLDKAEVPTTLVYDSAIDWQRINFQTMKAIARTLKHTKVQSAS